MILNYKKILSKMIDKKLKMIKLINQVILI